MFDAHRRVAAVVASALMLLAAGQSLAQEQPGRNPDRLEADDQRTVCLSDQFFVHVPTWASAGGVAANFRRQLRTDLRGYIGGVPSLAGVTVTVEPVLMNRAAVAERSDGHLRFWAVKTSRSIRSAELCGFIGALRTRASALAGGTVYVGRECVAGGLVSPNAPDWPLEVMGKPGLLPRGRNAAAIVVLDAGFKSPPDWSAPGASGAKHPHGAMVKGVIDQAVAGMRGPMVSDFRVLGEDGSGTLADVARGIDTALFGGQGPMVLNLSLGWPPELERKRSIPGCAEVEDPIGEAVRYTLAMAALRDQAQLTRANGGQPIEEVGPTVVTAAAGNRPVLFGTDVTGYYERHYRVDRSPLPGDCSQPSGDGLFYPAQWARRATCLQLGGQRITLNQSRIVAVGATDHRDERSPLSAPEMTPILVAPGVGVRIDGVRWTGSSVSTAYVSVALSMQLATSGTGQAAVLAVLGRATALPGLSGGVPVKRLNFARPHAAGAPVATRGVRRIDGSRATPITGMVRNRCGRTLARWMNGTATSGQLAAVCPAFLTDLDRFSVGDAGPQPPTTGCPECYADFDAEDEKLDLHVTLTDEWDPASTTIDDPHLVVSWPDGYESWIPMPGGPTDWAPKQSFIIDKVSIVHPGGKSSAQDLLDKGSISLTMTVTQSDGKAVDVSVVVMED